MRKELNIFLNALMFYSRIPVPFRIEFSNEVLNKATRYFTLVGMIIGGLGALLYWLAALILPLPLAVALSMAGTIFITGAFHEDGFADFCDGFGGGYSKEKILDIMKDSRIGTYGSIGLVLMLLTKFLCLLHIQAFMVPILLVAAHAFSRVLPVGMIYISQYVRDDLKSKVKPIGHRDSPAALIVAMVFGTVALFWIPLKAVLLIVVSSVVLFVVFRFYVEKKIGGYTGDVLGALQQLAELIFYLGFLIFQNNLS